MQHAPDTQAAAEAAAFQTRWCTELRLFHNDCRDHTNKLVAHLTGVQNVLAQLPVHTRRPLTD